MAKGMECMGWGNCGAAAPDLRRTKGIFLSAASRRAKMCTEYTFCKNGGYRSRLPRKCRYPIKPEDIVNPARILLK